MILSEAGLIAVIGGVLGLALASFMVQGVRSALSVVGLSTLSVTPDVAAVSLLLALFIGVGSSIVPAWTAARTPILDSLRSTV